MRPVRILFVTPEFGDFVKVGGLGEVSAALPRALGRLCDIRVLVPGYRRVVSRPEPIEIVGACNAFAGLPACSIGRLRTADGMTVYVVLSSELYDRDGTPYLNDKGRDWQDNDIRFGRFAAAAADLAQGLVDADWKPDLVHVNDWHSALVPAYLHWRSAGVPTILTIHNLAYQGLFPRDTLARIGAPPSAFDINGVEFYDKVSFLKAGLVYASHLTTVSATYADEITTPQFGCGLDGLLRLRAERRQLTGILNGVDRSWDSRTCPDLASTYECGNWKGKRANADHVRNAFGLAISRGPLFGLVARLVHQKGVDLVLEAADAIVSAGGQIVVTGTGERYLEHALQAKSRSYAQSIAVNIRYEEGEARRIFAASDFMLMPSRFEPCGLTQMYAKKFGSLPIGHHTGGLADTIEDGKTGFLFREPSLGGLLGAVCRAFSTYASKRQLNSMRRKAMERVFSWEDAAQTYGELYQRVAQ
jgi:starch synthase